MKTKIDEFSFKLTKETMPHSGKLKKYGEFNYDVYVDENAEFYVELFYNGSQTSYKLNRDVSQYNLNIQSIYNNIGLYLPRYGVVCSNNKNGISYECLTVNKYRQIRIHKIMAHVFLNESISLREERGNMTKNELVIHHVDGNRFNNKLSNLQLMDRRQHSKLETVDYKYDIYENGQLIDTLDALDDVRVKYSDHNKPEDSQYWNGCISQYISRGIKLKRKYTIIRRKV